MKKIARADKEPQIVGIPDITGIAPIVIKPKLGIIALQIEDVQVAVGIENV